MTAPLTRALALLCAPALALGLAACGTKAVSTSSFKGEEHEVAQTIANLQSDVSAADQQKICANDLASALVTKLNASSGGCKQAVKNQLAELDNFELAVQSVQISGAPAQRRATAKVRSIYEGKTRASTISLLKEGGKWKVSGLG
jgi:hypothetical protein